MFRGVWVWTSFFYALGPTVNRQEEQQLRKKVLSLSVGTESNKREEDVDLIKFATRIAGGQELRCLSDPGISPAVSLLQA
jgi:hypothetical protein